ncbi:MAG: radical SAM family heme chaperone HemW [Ferruginibacter sp.]
MAGIYIHIPFCRQACSYCNFHFSTSLTLKNDFLAALNNEIMLTVPFSSAEKIETIYFGGGTPSLLSTPELAAVLFSLKNKFKISDDVEITLEANPDDINKSILEGWQSCGINRLSLGVQSFAEKELIWMNRAHNAAQSLKSIDDILETGFKNFSVDLIYGSPSLSNKELTKNAAIIFNKNIPHISCYALTVEPRTALNKMIAQHKTAPVNPGQQAEQFQLLLSLTEQAGYEQYEISNFAKPGYRSRHNSSYWQGQPYYGFGPAAHSFDGKKIRRWNIANNALYIQSLKNNIIPFEEEVLSQIQQLNEYIMISLRTMEGLNILKVQKDFGEKKAEKILSQSKKYLDQKLIKEQNGFIILTKEGKFLADGIAADLFF